MDYNGFVGGDVIEEIGHEHNDVLCLGFKEHETSDNTINACSYSLKKEE
jgi:hypothetical protein